MNAFGRGYGTRISDADLRTDALGAVSSLLWRERETLERLLYALTLERLIVTAGAARWLATADEHVREAVAELQDREIIRMAEVDALARTMRLPSGTTLGQLTEFAAEPWATIFTEHRTALRALVTEIDAVRTENCRLLQAGADAARRSLDLIDRGYRVVAGDQSTGVRTLHRAHPVIGNAVAGERA